MNPEGAGEWLSHLRCEILLSRSASDPHRQRKCGQDPVSDPLVYGIISRR